MLGRESNSKSKIKRNAAETKAYLVGGGIGSLAAAVYMLRDGGMQGRNIHILEVGHVNGGAMDGSGNPAEGYMIRGGRMLNEPAYECLQDLMHEIPSMEFPDISLYQEYMEFNEEFKTVARARLVNADGSKVDVTKMGFDKDDRGKMMKLIMEKEENLNGMRINQYFDAHFFETNFWYMWQTTFGFEPWNSATELKRYMIRFMHEFPRIHTLAGVSRTTFNQYESIIEPFLNYLANHGVQFRMGARVNDIVFKEAVEGRLVSEIRYTENGTDHTIAVEPDDMVFFTNGSMVENAAIGTHSTPAEFNRGADAPSFSLWKKIAAGRPEFGKPEVFCGDPNASAWQSFTVTINDNPALFDYIQRFTRNHPGGGALMTFKDSNWLLSTVVARQPHFRRQPANAQVFWGYGLYLDKPGNHVPKTMPECSGAEIMSELLFHLHALEQEEALMKNVICKPCIMPYITSMFMPRSLGDRPQVLPDGYENFAFLGQFSEQPDDVVFTVEYSCRTAQRAVYHMLGVDKKLTPVNKHEREPKVLLDSFLKLHS